VGAEIPNLPWAESGHPLRVFSVHVPSGPGSYVGQADRILDAIAGLPGPADVLLAGDFNLTVSRGESGLPRRENPAVLRLLDRLQDQFGLVSAWEAANPGSLLPQTLRWARDPTAPYHCDGIFMPRSWVHRLARVSVVAGDAWSVRSDHNPVLVELED
jgi:endonuclease/exonuclease/phosphatase family metal-dependent hydrolase